MSLQKDLTKLKNILLVIDVILLLAVVASSILCLFWLAAEKLVPSVDLETSMQEFAAQEAELDKQIAAVNETLKEDLVYLETDLENAGYQVAIAQSERDAAQQQRDSLKQMTEDVKNPLKMQEHIETVRREYGAAIRQLEDMIIAGESDYRICYLTFDDGPTYQTDKFLDVLEELDAKATFFTIGIGIGDERNLHIRDDAQRREAREGHAIANHTFTHAYYGPLYKSVDTFMEAVRQQDELVYAVTGMHTEIVRFPSGSHYTAFREGSIQALLDEGYQWMDWIGNAMDAGSNGYDSAHIASNVIWQSKQDKITVILMHDWNINTLGALKQIVNTLRNQNYLFLPLFKESSTNGNCIPKWG